MKLLTELKTVFLWGRPSCYIEQDTFSPDNKDNMNFPRLFTLTPMFRHYLDQFKEHKSETFLANALMLMACDFITLFEESAELCSLQFTSVCLLDPVEDPSSLRIRHHFKLLGNSNGPGGAHDTPVVPAQFTDLDDYALDHLPWESMGNFSFTLERSHPLVQAALMVDAEELTQAEACIYGLALHLFGQMKALDITQDLGLRSAG